MGTGAGVVGVDGVAVSLPWEALSGRDGADGPTPARATVSPNVPTFSRFCTAGLAAIESSRSLTRSIGSGVVGPELTLLRCEFVVGAAEVGCPAPIVVDD